MEESAEGGRGQTRPVALLILAEQREVLVITLHRATGRLSGLTQRGLQ